MHKRHSRKRPLDIPLCLVLTGLLGGGVLALPVPARAEQKMTTDEFLDYSLWALNQEMLRLSDENRKMDERNNALQRTLEAAEEEMRQLAAQRKALRQDRKELMDRVDLGSQGASLWKKKLINAEHSQDILSRQRQRLKSSIEKEQKRRDILLNGIRTTEDDIRDFYAEAEQGGLIYRLQAYRDERRKMGEEMHEARVRYNKKELDLSPLKEDLRAGEKERQKFLDESKILKDRVTRLGNDLGKIREEQKRIKLQTRWFRDQKDTRIEALKQEIGDWSSYRDALRESIEQVRDLRKKIAAESRRQERTLAAWRKISEEENRWLHKRQEGLQDTLVLARDAASAAREDAVRQDALQKINGRLDDLEKAGGDIRDRIDINRGQARQMTSQEKDLGRAIEKLQRERDAVRQENEQEKAARMAKREAELARQVREKERNIPVLRSDIQAMTDKLKQMDNQLLPLKTKQQELKQQVSALQDQNQGLLETQQQLSDKKKELQQQSGKSGTRALRGIEDLRLQRDILKSTLADVQSRYKGETGDSTADEKELTEYLRILKGENRVLQRQILNLMHAVGREGLSSEDQPDSSPGQDNLDN